MTHEQIRASLAFYQRQIDRGVQTTLAGRQMLPAPLAFLQEASRIIEQLLGEVQAVGEPPEQAFLRGQLAGTRRLLQQAGQVIAWECFGDPRTFGPEPIPAPDAMVNAIYHSLGLPLNPLQRNPD